MDLKKYIKQVPDFPKKGILYRDIQPLLADHSAFSAAVSQLYSLTLIKPDYYVGIESRVDVGITKEHDTKCLISY